VQEAQTLVDEAASRGVDEPWVRALRRRLRVITTKRAIRAAAPTWSGRVAAAHRWTNGQLRNLRR
jgi:hypothetical protein